MDTGILVAELDKALEVQHEAFQRMKRTTEYFARDEAIGEYARATERVRYARRALDAAWAKAQQV